MTISRARTAASGAQAPCWVFEGLDAAIIAAGVLLKARTGRDWAVIPKLKGQEMRVLKRNKVRDCSNERWRLLPILAGLVATGLFISSAAAESTIWLEAEQFDQRGGWVNDSQFIDQMGSPYLIANGLGKPVADAVKTVTIANAGRYRLWVRTKDWAPEHHPGRFAILLGDRAADHVFGASGKTGWQWEDGGAHELSGTVKVGLRDLTGYYGRCDVIVLCDDLNWTPPQDKDAIARLREQFGAVSRTVKTIGEYDVVVVGGGLAGCMAAVSAARMGAHTALIQDRPVLGGNASVEVLVPPVGARPEDKLGLDPRETGLVEEIRTAGDQRTAEARVYSGRLDRLVRAEPNLDLWLNTHAEGVEMKSADTIGAVTAVDVNSGQRMRFGGRTFVDCTGDGVIGVEAGAEFRHGREPRSMYNESMAPEVGDNQTMGNSLKYVSEETSAPQQFEAPPWAMKFDSCDKFPPRRHPPLGGDIGWQWMIELGGTRNTYLDAEEIRDDLLRLIYGLWDHVKNHCAEQRQKAANHRLVWVEYVAGKRESRRLIGDYVLTENDIAGQTLFPDRVAYGGWGADDHFPEGFFYSGLPSQHLYRGVLFSIPYRSLYSRNIQNLLMAGRNISASHIALGATRVMLTCAVIGQSAGTAAAMCVEHNARARGIHGKYLTQLQQQILKDGAYIIGLPNRDRRDLARKATVRASSEQTDQSGKVMVAANVINGYARVEGDNFNAWMPDP
ncbi:FAD-dependent oxidoreductase, partial [Candidatus Sumerlaeota bacterium]|nr:FAD-dependent oxidoreductase [Candidatus Sumerlaeota bacterium]